MDAFILPHPSTQNLVEDHQQERAHWGTKKKSKLPTSVKKPALESLSG